MFFVFGGGGSGGASPLTTKGDIFTFSTVNARLPVGTDGQVLSADSAQATGLKWITASGTGTVTNTGGALTLNSVILGAGGNDTKVVTGITTDGTSKINLGVAGTSVGSIDFRNVTSGAITLTPTTGALGTSTITMPATTGTMTVLGNTTTGSGSIVLATSPTLVTPVLGVATATSINKVVAVGKF